MGSQSVFIFVLLAAVLSLFAASGKMLKSAKSTDSTSLMARGDNPDLKKKSESGVSANKNGPRVSLDEAHAEAAEVESKLPKRLVRITATATPLKATQTSSGDSEWPKNNYKAASAATILPTSARFSLPPDGPRQTSPDQPIPSWSDFIHEVTKSRSIEERLSSFTDNGVDESSAEVNGSDENNDQQILQPRKERLPASLVLHIGRGDLLSLNRILFRTGAYEAIECEVSDPNICEIIRPESGESHIFGIAEGITSLTIRVGNDEDVAPKRLVAVEVRVQSEKVTSRKEAEFLVLAIHNAYPGCNITIEAAGRGMLVAGKCDSEKSARKILFIVRKIFLRPIEDRLDIEANPSISILN